MKKFRFTILLQMSVVVLFLFLLVGLTSIIFSDVYAKPNDSRYDNIGWFYVDIYGDNQDVDTGSVPEDVWPGGGAYSWPTSAATTVITSSDSNDATGETGARTVYVEGLDGDYDIINETVSLSGTNVVTLTNSFFRINSAYVATAGSSGINEGTVMLSQSGTVVAQMAANTGKSLAAIYTVPDVYAKAELCYTQLSIGRYTSTSTATTQSLLQFRPESGAWRTMQTASARANGEPFIYDYLDCIDIPAKADLRWRVDTVAADNTNVVASYQLRLKR